MLLLKFWERLRGPSAEFPLEKRILNSGGLFSMCTLLIFVLYDSYVVVIPELAIVSFIAFLLQLFLYYQSRFKRNFAIARYGFTFLSYIFLVVNYYYGAGIDGPLLFSFFLSLIVIIFIHHKHRYIYLLLHILVICSLLYFEYRYGVPKVYGNKSERFLDIACIIAIMLSLTYILVGGVIRSYNKERRLARERAEALQLLHQENNRLFSIISHDLRTPLNSIQGYLELLRNHSLKEMDKSMLEGQLLELTNGTSEFLGNLLAWSKSQLEGTKVNLVTIDFNTLLDGVLSSVCPLATKKQVQIKKEILTDQLFADLEMTRIVLRNLLTNAIKYSKTDSEVTIKSWQDKKNFILSVQDFGVGIAKDKQAFIFKHQAQSIPGTANELGVGLGLVLCADFIALQNGKIWFESELGKGTTFFVSFPAI
ncbi:sensor histidine kinase [Pedobacter sp.]